MKEPKEASRAVFNDPWLCAEGVALKGLIEELAAALESQRRADVVATHGEDSKQSKRKPRREGVQARHTVTENIVANLVSVLLSPSHTEAQRLVVTSSKREKRINRYDRGDFPQDHVAEVLGLMEKQGIIIRHGYEFKRTRTSIEPSSKFRKRVGAWNIRLSDVGRMPGEETIWLWQRTGRRGSSGKWEKEEVLYADTEETERYRSQMETLNAYLQGADITFDGEPIAPFALHRNFLLRVDAKRHTFNLGGRLGGGMWSQLPGAERYRLSINGEQLADLDFRGMFILLSHLAVGAELPSGNRDPYELDELERGYREGIKKGILSLLGRTGVMTSLSPELRRLLPLGWTAKSLQSAITKRHPQIASMFGQDRSIELMFTESQILMAVLLQLGEMDIPALPFHDGICVQESAKGVAMRVMRQASAGVVGVALPVVEKPIKRPHQDKSLLLPPSIPLSTETHS